MWWPKIPAMSSTESIMFVTMNSVFYVILEKRFHYPGNKRTSEVEEQSSVGSNFSNTHAGSKMRTQKFDGINIKCRLQN